MTKLPSKIYMEKYRNKIICGNAIEVLKGFPDECIDCVITSPPYNR
jgi:DNA modification methylase